MSIQNIDQFRERVASLETQMDTFKNWVGRGISDDIKVREELPTVERNIQSTQEDIKKLAQKKLKESDFIEASSKLIKIIDGMNTLRNRCKIVDYKKLSFLGKIVRFFKESWLLGYTYISVENPINVKEAKRDVAKSVQEVLLSLAPKIQDDVPEEPLSKNVWGVKVSEGGFVSLFIRKKEESVFSFSITVNELGIQVSGTRCTSWEEAFQAVKAAHNIEGSFESVKAVREKSELELAKFTVEKVPAHFEGKWFIKKDGENFFYEETGRKIPIEIGIDGSFQAEGKKAENIMKLFPGLKEEDCLTKVYERKREEALKNLYLVGVEGTYKEEKFFLASGGVVNFLKNETGKIVVIDKENGKNVLVSVAPGGPVVVAPLEIQEDGTYSLPIDIGMFDFGCLRKVFVQNEKNKLDKMVREEVGVKTEGMQILLREWAAERKGFRLLEKKENMPSRVAAGVVEGAHKLTQEYAPSFARETIDYIIGSAAEKGLSLAKTHAPAFVGQNVDKIGDLNQPVGYSVEVFGCKERAFYPLVSLPNDGGFSVEISPGKKLTDIFLSGLIRQIKEECDAGNLRDIQKDIKEKIKKYNEALNAIPMWIQVDAKSRNKTEIEKRFELAQKASERDQKDKSIWETAPYFGCTWWQQRTESLTPLHTLSVKPKGKECIHIDLDMVSEPGNIRLRFPDGLKTCPANEFKSVIEKFYPGIVLPESWDKEYRKIEPFINELNLLQLAKGGLNLFLENARFLGDDAQGAVYGECSELGEIVFHIVGKEQKVSINLLDCVKEGKLIVNEKKYDSIKAFLDEITSKSLMTPEALNKLAEETGERTGSLVRDAKEVDDTKWNAVVSALKGEKVRVWEIIHKEEGRYASLFLRIADEAPSPLSLVKGSREEAWKLRFQGKEFRSMDELLADQHLVTEDRYAAALVRKEKVDALGSLLMQEQKGVMSYLRTVKEHNFFYTLTKDGEEELFSKMKLLSQEIEKPISAIYKKDNKYYRATIDHPYLEVENDEIVIHATDVPYFSIERDQKSGKAVKDIIPEGMIDLEEGARVKKAIEALRSLLMYGEQKGVKSYVKTVKAHNFFYTLTKDGEEELFSKMKQCSQEIKKPISAIYNEGTKYYRATIETPYLVVKKDKIVFHATDAPYFSIEGDQKKGKAVKDIIPEGMIDMEEGTRIKEALAQKFSLKERSYLVLSAVKESYFTHFSSFEDAEKSSDGCLATLGNKKLFVVFLNNEGRVCLFTRTKDRGVKKYYINEENGRFSLEEIPDKNKKKVEYDSFSAICKRAGDIISYAKVQK